MTSQIKNQKEYARDPNKAQRKEQQQARAEMIPAANRAPHLIPEPGGNEGGIGFNLLKACKMTCGVPRHGKLCVHHRPRREGDENQGAKAPREPKGRQMQQR